MTDAPKNNNLPAKNGRNADGTFAKDHPYYPRSAYRYADRAATLQEELTAEQILALAADDKALGKRPSIDTIVIRRLARAMKKVEAETCADVERATEAHLDRVEGKPVATVHTVERRSITDNPRFKPAYRATPQKKTPPSLSKSKPTQQHYDNPFKDDWKYGNL